MNDPAIFGILGLLIGGGGVWAVMRGRLALSSAALADAEENHALAAEAAGHNAAMLRLRNDQRRELAAAHSRLSDAHNSTKERIERALECETPGANATVKRMARILKGDA